MSSPARSPASVFLLSALAMLAFAANSLLARLGLATTGIDAATFTAVRLLSGALLLGLIVRGRNVSPLSAGGWPAALALFVYAAAFSVAYVVLEVGTGALLLFGAVQLTMTGRGLWRGERFSALQLVGLLAALGGFVYLLLPGVAAPPPLPAALMVLAGTAWGVYSLLGRGVQAPTLATVGNFARAAPLALLLLLAASLIPDLALRLDALGVLYALLSGALTSSLGYLVWYAVLPSLRATTAATVQLSVPVIAGLGGVVILGEPLTLRLALATVMILGGIALVLRAR